MLKVLVAMIGTTLFCPAEAAAQEQIRISSEWGDVLAELNDSAAARALLAILPLNVNMHDHLRQEKTGDLPKTLPSGQRRLDFAVGTLGLWSSNHFVIYYRDGRVPSPGIVHLGLVKGDVAIFDRAGDVSVRIERQR